MGSNLSNDDSTTIDIDEVVHETEKAYQIKIGDDTHWLPKSQVQVMPKVKKLHGPKWLLKKNGLI